MIDGTANPDGTATKRQIVDCNNARNPGYLAQLREIEASGQCPFCDEGLTFTDSEEVAMFVHELDTLHIKLNAHPYEGSEVHFVLIFKAHHETADELSAEEWADVGQAMAWIRETHNVGGGVFQMREGDTDRTGATVVHLHGQYFTPKLGELVTVYFSGTHPEAAIKVAKPDAEE